MALKDIDFSVKMYGTTPIIQSNYDVAYTGDESSINLRFAVTDEPELEGATAIVHLKFADSSHIERSLELTESVFSYTLKGTENKHAGVVRADIIITKGGAKFTRAGHKFKIDTSLDASVPLIEYAVDTLDTLVDGAEEWLLQTQIDFGIAQSQRADEWVADNDARADEFAESQTDRTSAFNASEASRTIGFNASETGRSNTFTVNENAREAAAESGEAARGESFELSEYERATTFGESEAGRVITFNGSEADRTIAFNLAEAARSEGYTKDHDRAGTDHTRAENDHDIALTDQENYDTLLTNLQETINDANENIAEFDVALQNGIVATNIAAELQNLEETYAPNIVSLTSQLAENKTPKGRNSSEALISIITDDSTSDDMTTMLPIFDRQGVPFCTAVVTTLVGTADHTTLEDLISLQSSGHEIMSHSHTHAHLTEATPEELDNELRLSKEYLASNGIKIKNFAVPYGQTNDAVKLTAQKYYRASRITTGYFNNKPIESYELKAIWIENIATVSSMTGFARNSLDHYKWFIDQAYANNSWLIISTHSWEIKAWGYEQLLEDIVVYAKTKATVLTVNEALDKVDNLVESALFSKSKPYEPHFALSPDGKIDSNLTFFKKIATSSVTPSTPLSAFEDNVVSVCTIQHLAAAGFPKNTPGILFTYKFIPTEIGNITGYSYQDYKLLNSDESYRRTAKADGSWGDFYLCDYSANKILVKEIQTHKPSDLQANHITTWGFDGGDATAYGMPAGIAGTLYAYSFGHYGGDYAYYYEIYKARNSTAFYVRNGISNDTWSAWVNPNDISAFPYITAPRGTYAGDSLPNAYPVGKVINTTVTSNTPGMPSTASGLLIINTTGLLTAGATDYGYVTREFTSYGGTNKFIQTATSGTTWSAWTKVTVV